MTEQEFLETRVPFWLEGDDLRVTIPSANDRNEIHSYLSKKFGFSWMFAIRGYIWPNSHIQLYTANYNIPNVTVYVISYLFELFKDIKYIGLGCIIGNPGEIWKPQLVVYHDIRGI